MIRPVLALLAALVFVGCPTDRIPTSIEINVHHQEEPDSVCTAWRFSAGEPPVCVTWVHPNSKTKGSGG